MELAAKVASRGMTVIETLVAVALFTGAVVVVIGVFPASVRALRQSHSHLVAATLAEKELEFCRAQDYDALENRDESYSLTQERSGISTTITYRTHLEISLLRQGLKRVLVTVEWKDTEQMQRQLRMETYVARLAP